LSDLVEKTKVLLEILPEEKLPPNFGEGNLHDIGEMFQVPLVTSASAVQRPRSESSTFKFNEQRYLDEVHNYIQGTYSQHYVEKDGRQTYEDMLDAGYALGYSMGSALKYVKRFGKKEGQNRKDILKTIHCAILALHALDQGQK
jgi:hypothetical protein